MLKWADLEERPALKTVAYVASALLGLPAGLLAQDRPPTVEEHFGGPPAGVHQEAPAPPGEYDPVDPFDAPNHPVRGEKDPGEEWSNSDPETGPLRGFSVQIQTASGDWDWKELFYDGTYASGLHVTNECKTPEPVYISHDLPYLEIQSTAVIPPGGITVPATIRTPPTPPPPIRTANPGEPGYGWVQPPHYDPATGTSVRMPGEPEFHQPNFLDVKGKVTAWHPYRGVCLPSRRTWSVTGHVHFRPPPPEGGDAGPSRIATADPCVVYWNLGAPPPGFEHDPKDCTDVFRGLALDYVTRMLGGRIAADPDAWSWLPGAGEISTLTAAELLELKSRIDAQLDAGEE